MSSRTMQAALFCFSLFFLGGCAVLSPNQEGAPEKKADEPKTMLTWAVGPKSKDQPNGDDKDKKNGDDKDKKNGNGEEEKAEEPDRIATDRPDFTESSSTVGKGRVQLEGGYTFVRDSNGGTRTTTHSYPELLLRVGMFAEWFEFRVGQNFANERDSSTGISRSGAADLYLGTKFFLTEQAGIFPESSLVLQTFVPSGLREFSGKQVLPGFNLLYGWDVIEERVTFAGSTQVNRRFDEGTHYYAEYAQSFTTGFKWNKKLGNYAEWFCLIPSGAVSSETRTQHYFNAGITYLVTDNFQLDIRAGVGLNRFSDDFFAGTGFGVRY